MRKPARKSKETTKWWNGWERERFRIVVFVRCTEVAFVSSVRKPCLCSQNTACATLWNRRKVCKFAKPNESRQSVKDKKKCSISSENVRTANPVEPVTRSSVQAAKVTASSAGPFSDVKKRGCGGGESPDELKNMCRSEPDTGLTRTTVHTD